MTRARGASGSGGKKKPARHLVLPSKGKVLISTDLHGNAEDFRRLSAAFLELKDKDPAAHWVMLGDIVHGPDDDARKQYPDLYGFPDESWAIVEGAIKLRKAHPEHFHYVLGNHDHGHVGGPHTAKFHPDEVDHLESSLSTQQLTKLRAFFSESLLAVIAPCGALLTHGSPDDALTSIEVLDRISLALEENDETQNAVLRTLMTSYGQRREVTAKVLQNLSKDGPKLTMVVHGHDKEDTGYFVEGGNQVCPVIFGAPNSEKRYLVLSLSTQYDGPDALREDKEIKSLYPAE